MADTFSATIGVALMQTGNDNNTWGTIANNSVFQILEDAIANVLTEAVTGGTVDLSGSPPPAAASQARYYSIKFTGVLTSNQTLIVPNLTKMWLFENLTTGNFSVFVKTTAGTATQIPQGTLRMVRCDGANGMKRLDSDEIGRVEDYATTSVPNGFLECDGSAISRTGVPDLFAKIGTTWGVGDGFTTFNIPNLKDTGRFKRSRTGSLAVGTYQSNQNLAHTHTGTTDATSVAHIHNVSGATGGMSQNDPHSHSQQSNTVLNAGGGSATVGGAGALIGGVTQNTSIAHTHGVNINSGGMSASDPHTHTFTSASSGGAEARPEAAVVLSCIRY